MLVTMFTDASFHNGLKRGVWAAWAKADGNTIRYSGILKSEMPHCGEAELSAIANGLVAVKSKLNPEIGSRIICQTDSNEAITALNSHDHPRAQAKHIVNYIWAFAREAEWRLDLRHVKGHKGTATPRNAVNTWCDKECRRRMGELLQSLKEVA